MDIAIADLSAADLEIWEYITYLSCDLLVTTRCKQLDHIIPVEEIGETSNLRQFFFQGGQTYAENQLPFIDKIIEVLGGHTLLIELIARKLIVSKWMPEQMMDELQRFGFASFPGDTISFSKDGRVEDATLIEHIKKLFSLATISEEQKLMLAQLAFMPVYGISASVFSRYFSLDDYNVIIIHNGLMKDLSVLQDAPFTALFMN